VRRQDVLEAFHAEAEQLTLVMLKLNEGDFSRPSPCPPWTVSELLGHVRGAIVLLSNALTQPAPPYAEVTAADYYRPDARYAPEANAERIVSAQREAAALGSGRALAEDFDQVWQRAYREVMAEPDDRKVRTNYGDAMLLTDYLVTRVVELAVHGLDLAAGLKREPWITEPAAQVVEELLLSVGGAAVVQDLGWDRLTFIRKATGREPLLGNEVYQVRRRGVSWLALS